MSAVGLLPWWLKVALEYAGGVWFVLAPFLLGFRDEGAAFPVSVAVGVALLVLGLLSRGRVGVAQVLPTRLHAAIDYVLGVALIVAPFPFGYTDVDAALLSSVVSGLLLVVVTLLTDVPGDDAAQRR